jgi:hypothetical protein
MKNPDDVPQIGGELFDKLEAMGQRLEAMTNSRRRVGLVMMFLNFIPTADLREIRDALTRHLRQFDEPKG